MQQFFLQPGDRSQMLARISTFLAQLSPSKAWRLDVSEHRPKRTNDQNSLLWGFVYPQITKHLPGWEAEDVHTYLLGEHFGWETLEGLGRKRVRPLRRSSKLSTTEFSDYLEFIQRKMAEHGLCIEMPEDVKP